MNPTNFAEANKVFTQPKDWDEATHGKVQDLYVYLDSGMITSVWKPSEEELAILNAGGGVALTIHGTNHPVVSLWSIVLDNVNGVPQAAAPSVEHQAEQKEDIEEVTSEIVEPHPEVVDLSNETAALSPEEEHDTIEDLIAKGQTRN